MISQLDHPKKSLIFSGTGHTDLFVFLVACFIPAKGNGWIKKIPFPLKTTCLLWGRNLFIKNLNEKEAVFKTFNGKLVITKG